MTTVDRLWLLERRAAIVSALAEQVKDDPTGHQPRSVVADCMGVVADELLKLVDELCPVEPVEPVPASVAGYPIGGRHGARPQGAVAVQQPGTGSD